MSPAVQKLETLPARTEPVTPMQMLQTALENGADMDKLQKLMDLQERWEANQARKAFDAAISAAKAEIKPILKKSEVDFPSKNGVGRTNYKYEQLADIAEHVDPILSKYGLSYRHRPKQDARSLSVTCILSHKDGHSEETTLMAANDETGNKNSIQSIGSTATYLQRYTLKLALGLAAAKDDDGQRAGALPRISAKQVADLQALATEVNADMAKYLRFLRVSRLEDIAEQAYADAVKALENKRKR